MKNEIIIIMVVLAMTASAQFSPQQQQQMEPIKEDFPVSPECVTYEMEGMCGSLTDRELLSEYEYYKKLKPLARKCFGRFMATGTVGTHHAFFQMMCPYIGQNPYVSQEILDEYWAQGYAYLDCPFGNLTDTRSYTGRSYCWYKPTKSMCPTCIRAMDSWRQDREGHGRKKWWHGAVTIGIVVFAGLKVYQTFAEVPDAPF